MNSSFRDKLRLILKRKGHHSLRSFYRKHSFSFSYEYLRQILSGQKVPAAKKVAEIAGVLGVNEEDLQRSASETRLSSVIRRHYRTPEATRLGRLSEKVQRYREQGRAERKILAMLERLGRREKDQLLDYLKFLGLQWRQRNKKAK